MTVVKFPQPMAQFPDGWQSIELQQFLAVSASAIAEGNASGWEVGATEQGDPQVFLLGPPPDYECVLSISRIGRVYVVEDGYGRVLFEDNNPMLLAEHAKAALRRGKASIVARVAVAWAALREAVEEKTEVMMAEPIELLTHIAPQLVALA